MLGFCTDFPPLALLLFQCQVRLVLKSWGPHGQKANWVMWLQHLFNILHCFYAPVLWFYNLLLLHCFLNILCWYRVRCFQILTSALIQVANLWAWGPGDLLRLIFSPGVGNQCPWRKWQLWKVDPMALYPSEVLSSPQTLSFLGSTLKITKYFPTPRSNPSLELRKTDYRWNKPILMT